jgi:hypothetical protein
MQVDSEKVFVTGLLCYLESAVVEVDSHSKLYLSRIASEDVVICMGKNEDQRIQRF